MGLPGSTFQALWNPLPHAAQSAAHALFSQIHVLLRKEKVMGKDYYLAALGQLDNLVAEAFPYLVVEGADGVVKTMPDFVGEREISARNAARATAWNSPSLITSVTLAS